MTSAVPPTVPTYIPNASCTCPTLIESVRADPLANPVSLNDDIGIFAVSVCVPSFKMQVESPVARSAVRALNVVDEITVPVTTGWPVELILKVPLEKDILYPFYFADRIAAKASAFALDSSFCGKRPA